MARGATPLLGQREAVAIQLPRGNESGATAVIFGADSHVEVFDCTTVMLFRGTARAQRASVHGQNTASQDGSASQNVTSAESKNGWQQCHEYGIFNDQLDLHCASGQHYPLLIWRGYTQQTRARHTEPAGKLARRVGSCGAFARASTVFFPLLSFFSFFLAGTKSCRGIWYCTHLLGDSNLSVRASVSSRVSREMTSSLAAHFKIFAMEAMLIPRLMFLSHLSDSKPSVRRSIETRLTCEESMACNEMPSDEQSQFAVSTSSLVASMIFLRRPPYIWEWEKRSRKK